MIHNDRFVILLGSENFLCLGPFCNRKALVECETLAQLQHSQLAVSGQVYQERL